MCHLSLCCDYLWNVENPATLFSVCIITCAVLIAGCWDSVKQVPVVTWFLSHWPSAGNPVSCQPCRSPSPNSTETYTRSCETYRDAFPSSSCWRIRTSEKASVGSYWLMLWYRLAMPWWVQSLPSVGRMCPSLSDLRKDINVMRADILLLKDTIIFMIIYLVIVPSMSDMMILSSQLHR